MVVETRPGGDYIRQQSIIELILTVESRDYSLVYYSPTLVSDTGSNQQSTHGETSHLCNQAWSTVLTNPSVSQKPTPFTTTGLQESPGDAAASAYDAPGRCGAPFQWPHHHLALATEMHGDGSAWGGNPWL